MFKFQMATVLTCIIGVALAKQGPVHAADIEATSYGVDIRLDDDPNSVVIEIRDENLKVVINNRAQSVEFFDGAQLKIFGGTQSNNIRIFGNSAASSVDITGGNQSDAIDFDADSELRVIALAGDDELIVRKSQVVVASMGEGDDFVDATGGELAWIQGEEGNDEILAPLMTNGYNYLMGGPGDDVLEGFAGTDVCFGQDGNDVIKAGLGNDLVVGGAGFDIVDGGPGDDTLVGNHYGRFDYGTPDGEIDVLVGGPGCDEFFSVVYDKIGSGWIYSTEIIEEDEVVDFERCDTIKWLRVRPYKLSD